MKNSISPFRALVFSLASLFLLITACKPNQPAEQIATEPALDSITIAEPAPDSATEAPGPAVPPVESWKFSYQLDQPSETFKLPGRLNEISGLSLSSDGKWLLAVNDEQGKIFYIDKKTGEVGEDIRFENAGDYEGVEAVGDKIFTVKSNGRIYEVANPGSKDQQTEKHDTFLDGSNNVEGLGFDAKGNRLLLACKGIAGKGLKGKRAVYAFDLTTKKLLEKPAYLIDEKAIELYFKKEGIAQTLIEMFAPGQAADAFAPSGVAVHPLTGDVYLIASVGKLLVVMSSNGEIRHMEKLDSKIHPQPEGICFDRDGTMFISSEGRAGKGRIVRYGF